MIRDVLALVRVNLTGIEEYDQKEIEKRIDAELGIIKKVMLEEVKKRFDEERKVKLEEGRG